MANLKAKGNPVVKTTMDRKIYHILTCIDQDPYPDDGYNCDKNGLYGRTRRQNKSWKNYRKNQWK